MIDDYLDQIAQSGILGVLLVVSLITVYFLYREARTERDNRLADLKLYSSEDRKFIQEIKYILDEILKSIKGTK
jgi:hypothetical protein